ncbi:MAG: PhoX family phosphatase [Dongiaceae bacterium]
MSDHAAHEQTTASSADRTRPVSAPYIQDIIAARLSRRSALLGMAATAGAGMFGGRLFGGGAAQAAPAGLAFKELARVYDDTDHVAPGYSKQVLIRWGDPLLKGAPGLDPASITAAAQEMQFGYNCDFVAFMPLPAGSNSSDHGLLCVNHEYVNPHIMWPGLTEDDGGKTLDKDQIEATMAAHGHSVVEIRKTDGKWQAVVDSPLNRRISMSTKIKVAGPAAGHPLLKTSADATGTEVVGTVDNCSGGTTPWGTVLFCEEGAADWFGGDATKVAQAPLFERAGYGELEDYYGWARFHDRFNIDKEPNEPNRYDWVVELDPYDPNSVPVKRTALGRFGHEAATTVVNKDGRVVVYLGDDDYFEYVYRFVSRGTFDPNDRAANKDLLDDGTLSVGRFNDDGTLDWLPLVFGQGPLTPDNGFENQGDVVLQARKAGDLLGATPMDRPEDFEPNPVNGRVYLVLTKNAKREAEQVNAANARAKNETGHIIELLPPGEGKDADHAADRFAWDAFILAGDPAAAHGAKYGGAVSANGWFACPDNIAFDPQGRLWIATDGAPDFNIADGLYAVEVDGPNRAVPRLLYAAPMDAEVCGPCFTPDGQTLFVAVQHPAEASETLEKASTRWPDFDPKIPPRPSIVVITRDGGGEIGA